MKNKQNHYNEFNHSISIPSYINSYFNCCVDEECNDPNLMIKLNARKNFLLLSSQVTHKEFSMLAKDYNLDIRRAPFDVVTDDSIEQGIVIMVFDAYGNEAPYLHPKYKCIPSVDFDDELSDDEMMEFGYYDEMNDEKTQRL